MHLLHSAVLKLKAGIDGFENDLDMVRQNRTLVDQGSFLLTFTYFCPRRLTSLSIGIQCERGTDEPLLDYAALDDSSESNSSWESDDALICFYQVRSERSENSEIVREIPPLPAPVVFGDSQSST